MTIANNSTPPYQSFYVAATSCPSSVTHRASGSVHVFSGSVYTGEDSVTRMLVQKTFEVNKNYLTGSGLTEASGGGMEDEFGSAEQTMVNTLKFDSQKTMGIGSTLDIETSKYAAGKENQVLLAIGTDTTIYRGNRSPMMNTTGSIMVVGLSGQAKVRNDMGLHSSDGRGYLTILPVRNTTAMLSSPGYTYAETGLFSGSRGSLKIISSSAHPYHHMNHIAVFSNPLGTSGNYHSGDPTGRDFIFMHTGSLHMATNTYAGSFNSSGNEIPYPLMSGTLDFTSSFNYRQDGKLYGLPIEYPHDPSYCAYTPPSYYGAAVARISFSPNVSGKYSLEEILSTAKVETVNNIEDDRVSLFSTYDVKNTLTEAQKSAATKVDSSVNLFGKIFDPAMEFDVLEGGEIAEISKASNDVSSENQRWVISTKFESPVLDFTPSDALHESLYTSNLASALSAHNFDVSANFDAPRGMWMSYGTPPASDKGIFFEVKESFSPDVYSSENSITGSLIKKTGFTSDAKKLGRTRESKEISEAICIIPYIKSSNTVSNNWFRDFFREIHTVDRPLVRFPRFNKSNWVRYSSDLGVFSTYESAVSHFQNRISFATKHDLIRVSKLEFNKQRKTFKESGGKIAVKKEDSVTGEEIRETSISNMIRCLDEYIIPPHLDPTRNIDPFAMYFMEVKHTLDKDDLINIWQNVASDVSLDFDKEEIDISHDIDKHNFFEDSKILKEYLNRDLSFMIFKVKKRAKTNYFDITKDSTDDERFRFDLKGGTTEVVPEYSYNWPYDYFSLIENASITMEVEMENPKPKPEKQSVTRHRRRYRNHLRSKLDTIYRARKRSSTHRPRNRRAKKIGNPYRDEE